MRAAEQQATENRENKTAPAESESRNMLKGYDTRQIENWKNSKSIVIYENDAQAEQFVVDSLAGNNNGKKIYFGRIPDALAQRIKNATGIDVAGYNCAISAYEIQKIFKDHGDAATEAKRGQRAIAIQDVVNIPSIILGADTISRYAKDYNGRPVIHFVKDENGRTTVTAYVSGKHLDLTVQTMFAGNKKKEPCRADR